MDRAVKKLRVLVLVREGLEPPETIENLPEDEYKNAEWKCEFDVVTTLENLGHQVRVQGVYSDLAVIRAAAEEFQPHVAFNLLEEWDSVALYDQNVVAYLELLGVRYTGCNPRGMMLARDKALSKKLLAYHRIRVPEFQVFPVGRKVKRPKRLAFPLFVKSVIEDASLGVSKASLVKDDAALAERVRFIHEKTGTDAIAEQFIEGRELYVSVTGNDRLRVFPVWELLFTEKPDDAPLIATRRAKWDAKYQKKLGVISKAAEDLPEGLAERLGKLSKRIYRFLCLSGYGRIDFRLSPEGKLYFLEANPNPQLAFGEDFAESVEKGGVDYEHLLQLIINLGMRYRPLRLS
jgi:D-alanine-D-alanine ligase